MVANKQGKYGARHLSGLLWAAMAPAALGLSAGPLAAQETAPVAPAAPDSTPADPATADKDGTPGDDSFDPDPDTPREPGKAALDSQTMIDAALKKVDAGVKRDGNSWQLELSGHLVLIVTDPIAERMRIITPIAQADSLDAALLRRMMQANFDSALDARYAIGQNLLWGTYIHPLVGLDEKTFLSGLVQTLNVAENFGGNFSSGAFVYGGGDSQGLIEEQLEELIRERKRANTT